MNTGRFDDTITAIATPPGRGGIGVIRLSGPQALSITTTMTGHSPEPRTAGLVSISSATGETMDEGLLLHFPAPRSFTGEHVAELHCHGGPVVLAQILRTCIDHGARTAEPGEFSKRAFLNGKLDLTQAEAIADLIASDTEAAARSAARTLSGAFSSQVNELVETLIRLRVFIEAAIDFPEEEIDFISDSDVLVKMENLVARVSALLKSAKRGRRLQDGMKLVLAGAPNVGKSSVLNALSGESTAIVTDIPGTTRDVLREHIELRGLPLHIVDTAGLREATDAVEREGIRRAEAELASADLVLLVLDASRAVDVDQKAIAAQVPSAIPESTPITVLRNKIDLLDHVHPVAVDTDRTLSAVINISAKTGEGLDALEDHLIAFAGLGGNETSDFSARARHLVVLESCEQQLLQGLEQLRDHGAAELIAEDLRNAQDTLGAITGRFHNDQLLGEIFGSFCIGK